MPIYSDYSDKPRRRKSTPPEQTDQEAVYLRHLIDSKTPVTVRLRSKDEIEGRLRYYDRDYFSIKVAETGLNILVRKQSVLYLAERS